MSTAADRITGEQPIDAVQKFDWDEHEKLHVLEVPGVKALFIYPTAQRRTNGFIEATDFVPESRVTNKRARPGGMQSIEFDNGAQVLFCREADIAQGFAGRLFSRIIIEEPSVDTDGLRELLGYLNEDSVVEPKLYVTYTNNPEVFVMRPVSGEGEISKAIFDLANG